MAREKDLVTPAVDITEISMKILRGRAWIVVV